MNIGILGWTGLISLQSKGLSRVFSNTTVQEHQFFSAQPSSHNITVIQVYAPTSNAKEAEVEQFYEDLQDLLELTPPKDVIFIIEYWNAKVGS